MNIELESLVSLARMQADHTAKHNKQDHTK